MNWTAEKLEAAIASAPLHLGHRVLVGTDARGDVVRVCVNPFNLGFDVLRKGVIHSLGERDAAAYLNAFGFVPDGAEVPK